MDNKMIVQYYILISINFANLIPNNFDISDKNNLLMIFLILSIKL